MNYRRLTPAALGCFAILATPAVQALATGGAGFAWDKVDGERVALRHDDAVVWQFNYGSASPKPFFHPVAPVGGEPLTVDRPSDHAWHHGLWFSWVFINAVNYWEHEPGKDRPLGETRWRDVKIEMRDDFSATIAMQLEYGPRGKPAVLSEVRTVDVSAPDVRGQYALDWRSEFIAGDAPVELACVPAPPAPDGVAWGGYAGLSIRFASDLQDRRATLVDREPEFDANAVWRERSAACDYSGSLQGKPAGIAIFEHRQNPRYPTTWYAIRSNMSYLNAAVLASGPLDVSPHDSFVLQYRGVVHPNAWDADAIANYARQLKSQMPPESSRRNSLALPAPETH